MFKAIFEGEMMEDDVLRHDGCWDMFEMRGMSCWNGSHGYETVLVQILCFRPL